MFYSPWLNSVESPLVVFLWSSVRPQWVQTASPAQVTFYLVVSALINLTTAMSNQMVNRKALSIKSS